MKCSDNDQGLTTFRECASTWHEACPARRVTKRNVPKAERELRSNLEAKRQSRQLGDAVTYLLSFRIEKCKIRADTLEIKNARIEMLIPKK